MAATEDVTPDSRVAGWSIRIYDLTSGATQQVVVRLLALVDTLTVEATSNGREHYVVVECRGERQAENVHDLVMAVDPNAKLIHSTDQRMTTRMWSG